MLAALDLSSLVPEGVRQSEGFRGFSGVVLRHAPIWNFGFALMTEIASYVAVRSLRVKRRWLFGVWFAVMLFMHIGYIFNNMLLDGGVRFFYASAEWAWVPVCFGLLVLAARRVYGVSRPVREQPDDLVREMWRRRRVRAKATPSGSPPKPPRA